MRYILLALLTITFSPAGFAQKKKDFTMSDATIGLGTTLAPKSIRQASWQPGTHNFHQVVKTGSGDVWVKTDAATGRTDTTRLSALNRYLFGRNDSLRTWPQVTWMNAERFYFQMGNLLYIAPASLKSDAPPAYRYLPEGAANVLVDKSRGSVAYTLDNNLYLLWSDGTNIQVSHDRDKAIVNGQAVHRNEFGIDGGIFFSPKGSSLAYYHMDQRMVKDYPVVDWSSLPAVANNIKYPMAGDSSHQVTLRIFNPITRQMVEIAPPQPDWYLTSVTWAPDEKSIFIGILNRDQNHLWLNQYDASTGRKMRTLFEETSPRYVEPQNPLSFVPGHNDQFLYWSQRDGFMHLYLYNTSGKLIRQLTKGKWLVNELLQFRNGGEEAVITGSKESPLEKHSYAVSLVNGRIRRLDTEKGTHTVDASDDGLYLYDSWSSDKTVRQAGIRNTSNGSLRMILDAPDPLADYNRAKVRNVSFDAADGTRLYGKLILPPDFDSTRKYPTIVYLYNGPHVQLVKNSFPASGNLWYEYMAQRGYIVFTMDGRGSANRGFAFESATFRNLGTVEMEDQLRGVEFLKGKRYVDAERMGVHGWSFGGFMTTSLMLRHPGVFKCAVAGGPVMDWRMYEVMYTERYMDTPQSNPEGYKTSNLIDKVSALKGKLLLIHGTDDDVVVWQHSIKFLKASVDKGVQVDYFVYPGHPHNVRGKDRVHLMQKITDYFDTFLKGN